MRKLNCEKYIFKLQSNFPSLLSNKIGSCDGEVLYIMTSKQVMCTRFAGQNMYFCSFLSFAVAGLYSLQYCKSKKEKETNMHSVLSCAI